MEEFNQFSGHPGRRVSSQSQPTLAEIDFLFSSHSDGSVLITSQPTPTDIDGLFGDSCSPIQAIQAETQTEWLDTVFSSKPTDSNKVKRRQVIPSVDSNSIDEFFSDNKPPKSVPITEHLIAQPVPSDRLSDSFAEVLLPGTRPSSSQDEVNNMLLKLFTKHVRTKSGIQELLSSINKLGASSGGLHIPQTAYLFKKIIGSPFTKSFNFETPCCKQVVFDFKATKRIDCPSATCGYTFTTDQITSKSNYSFHFVLREQLTLLFKKFDLKEQRFRDATIETIYDSAVYRKFHQLKQGSRVVALTVFADGVTSGRISFYTFIVKIDDLDAPAESKVFLNAAALSSKPNLEQFLGKVIEEFNSLWDHGVWAAAYGETVYPYIHAFVLDGKARPEFLRMSQFNTEEFCVACHVKGEQMRTEAGGTVRLFKHGEQFVPRKHIEFEAVAGAIQANVLPGAQRPMGIRDRTILLNINYLNIVQQVPPMDPMHSIIGGIVKRDIESMQSAKTKGLKCHISPALRRTLQRRIDQIRLNSEFKRKLDPFEKFNTWKTNQFADFFFYVAPVVFDSILDFEAYHHFLLLNYLIVSVWTGGVDLSEISTLRGLVQGYLNDHMKFYPIRDQTSNLHSLNHLVDTFILLGPLKNFNGFIFESVNGDCASMITSPRYVMEQIASRSELSMLLAVQSAQSVEATEEAFRLSGSKLTNKRIFVHSSDKQLQSQFADFRVWTKDGRCFEIKRHIQEQTDDRVLCEAYPIKLNGNLETSYAGRKFRIPHIFGAEIQTTLHILDPQLILEKVLFIPEFIPHHSTFADIRKGFIIRNNIPFHN